MAERPVNCYTSLAELDAEIRRVEQEVCETKLLHENLFHVHTLAGDVLRRMQNGDQTRSNNASGNNAMGSRPSNITCRSNGDRICACSPNQCQHVCVSPGSAEHQQLANSHTGHGTTSSATNLTSGVPSSKCPSRTTGVTSTTSGSTLAEFRAAYNASENTRSSTHQGSVTLISTDTASRHSNCSSRPSPPPNTHTNSTSPSNYSVNQPSQVFQSQQGQQYQHHHQHPQMQQHHYPYHHQQQPGYHHNHHQPNPNNTYTISSG